MKRFVINISLFVIMPVLVLGITLILISYCTTKTLNNTHSLKTKSRVFIGDSHIQQAVIDTLIPNSINISQNSESFIFSYYKLVHILSNENSIKEIYLGFSYHSISSYYDEFINGKFSNTISSRYFYILPIDEKVNFLRYNRDGIFSYIQVLMKAGLANKITLTNTVFGGYSNTFARTNAMIESMNKRIKFQFYSGTKIDSFSELNIEYLKKIINLCKKSNVRLILLNTPLHPDYKKSIPITFIEKYEQIVQTYNLELIDLSSLKLDDCCYIPDGDHVSQLGAKFTTLQLLEIIKK